MMKRTSWLAVALAWVLLLGGAGQPSVRADTIKIDDLGDGVPVVTSDNPNAGITILASGPEFVHFTLTTSAGVPAGTITDLVEPTTGILSDRLIITGSPGSLIVDVTFASDPVLVPGIPGVVLTETGTFQTLRTFSLPSGATDVYQVRSDVDESGTEPGAVPEPSSLALLGLGALGLIGYGWRRRKQMV